MLPLPAQNTLCNIKKTTSAPDTLGTRSRTGFGLSGVQPNTNTFGWLETFTCKQCMKNQQRIVAVVNTIIFAVAINHSPHLPSPPPLHSLYPLKKLYRLLESTCPSTSLDRALRYLRNHLSYFFERTFMPAGFCDWL